jgi:hypothetical protein
MTPQPQQHCDHECVCEAYRSEAYQTRVMKKAGEPCQCNTKSTLFKCPRNADTRSRPHTPPAPDEDTVTMPRWVFEWLMEPPKTVEDRKGHLNTEIAEIIKSLRHQSTEARK